MSIFNFNFNSFVTSLTKIYSHLCMLKAICLWEKAKKLFSDIFFILSIATLTTTKKRLPVYFNTSYILIPHSTSVKCFWKMFAFLTHLWYDVNVVLHFTFIMTTKALIGFPTETYFLHEITGDIDTSPVVFVSVCKGTPDLGYSFLLPSISSNIILYYIR